MDLEEFIKSQIDRLATYNMLPDEEEKAARLRSRLEREWRYERKLAECLAMLPDGFQASYPWEAEEAAKKIGGQLFNVYGQWPHRHRFLERGWVEITQARCEDAAGGKLTVIVLKWDNHSYEMKGHSEIRYRPKSRAGAKAAKEAGWRIGKSAYFSTKDTSEARQQRASFETIDEKYALKQGWKPVGGQPDEMLRRSLPSNSCGNSRNGNYTRDGYSVCGKSPAPYTISVPFGRGRIVRACEDCVSAILAVQRGKAHGPHLDTSVWRRGQPISEEEVERLAGRVEQVRKPGEEAWVMGCPVVDAFEWLYVQD